jgi:adenosylhomocysteine nucleosidase
MSDLTVPAKAFDLASARAILVIIAMEEEEKAIFEVLGKSRFSKTVVSSRLGIAASEASLGGVSVTVVRTGMGPVNAAVCTALILNEHRIDAILLLGVGGALSSKLGIGQLVVADSVLQHDYFSSLSFGDVRMKPGELLLREQDAAGYSPFHTPDPSLVELLRESSPCEIGTVLSGNEFVGTTERKRAIAKLSNNSQLVDMEAAGIAQVARRFDVPFAVAKTVADRLNPDGSIETDFELCLDSAARNAAVVLASMLETFEGR